MCQRPPDRPATWPWPHSLPDSSATSLLWLAVSGSHQDINAITIRPAHNKEAGTHRYISHPIPGCQGNCRRPIGRKERTVYPPSPNCICNMESRETEYADPQGEAQTRSGCFGYDQYGDQIGYVRVTRAKAAWAITSAIDPPTLTCHWGWSREDYSPAVSTRIPVTRMPTRAPAGPLATSASSYGTGEGKGRHRIRQSAVHNHD